MVQVGSQALTIAVPEPAAHPPSRGWAELHMWGVDGAVAGLCIVIQISCRMEEILNSLFSTDIKNILLVFILE